MTFEDCREKGLIKQSENARERVAQSISLGDGFLKSAERNLEIDEYEVCEIISYNALFHYARALLFDKGFIERSHVCLFIALKKLYPSERELFEEADRLRVERQNLQYAGFSSDKASAEFVLKSVKRFGAAAKKLLKR
ncbi:MAG: HEPN domain-containing protein [Candidatus Micrarchaeota archaeon]